MLFDFLLECLDGSRVGAQSITLQEGNIALVKRWWGVVLVLLLLFV